MADSWADIRDAIVAAFTGAAPALLATTSITWEDGAREFATHRIILSVVSSTLDDRDSALSTGGAQALESMVTMQVQAQFESVHDDPTVNALWLVEQYRLGLRRVSVREALAAEGMAITQFPGAARRVTAYADDRALSVYVLELQLRATLTFTSGEDAGLIEQVDGEAEFEPALTPDLEWTVTDPTPEP